MPLIKSGSKKAVSSNVSELINSYKKGGFAKGKDPGKARAMAVAAAFSIRKKLGGGK